MAQKTVILPEIGEVVLAKRKGSRSIRLSVSSAGKVRVGMPHWVPYSVGADFAKKRKDWVLKHLAKLPEHVLKNSERVGKSHRIIFTKDNSLKRTTSRVSSSQINITSSLDIEEPSVQLVIKKAAERALKKQAQSLLEQRLEDLAAKKGYSFKSICIKKLTSRWGSCSSDKVITLNYFLMQLPWHLIDYVLIHELVHTRHMNHSPAFWESFEKAYPKAKKTRAELRAYRPVINSIS